MNKKIFILGGGQSALYAAREIRKNNIDSEITILGEEKFIPYERPPLSKDFLLNKRIDEDLYFCSKETLEEEKINYLNTIIIKVDFENNILVSEDNKQYTYDTLLISTGSKNRKLNINSEIDDEIFYLRNLEEAKNIKEKALGKKYINHRWWFHWFRNSSSFSQLNKNISLVEVGNQLWEDNSKSNC